MAVNFLLDTSVLTRVANPIVRQAVLALDGTRARPSLVDLEIGYSARNGDEWDRLHDALETFIAVDVEAHHFRRAAQVQRSLAELGLKGRSVPDLLIAACAEDRGLIVVHYDSDFDHIAEITGQSMHWIVDRGSLD